MHPSTAARLIQDALSETERQQILEVVERINPRMKGADVQDVLDLAYNADHFVGEIEDLFDRFMPRTMGEDEGMLMWMGCIATRLLRGTADWPSAQVLCQRVFATLGDGPRRQ